MNEAMAAYFQGEKNAGLLLAGIGLVVLTSAAVLAPERWGARPFAVTLAAWGLLELAIGVGLYLKTGPQVAALAARLAADPSALRHAELARMARVQSNFVLIEYIEVALIVGCAVVAFLRKTNVTVSGIALGVLANATFLLAFDITAERRGGVYVAALDSPRAPEGR